MVVDGAPTSGGLKAVVEMQGSVEVQGSGEVQVLCVDYFHAVTCVVPF